MDSYKSREMVLLTCNGCAQIYHRTKHDIQCDLKKAKVNFCSLKCHGTNNTNMNTSSFLCNHCQIEFIKHNSQIRKTNFCGNSCRAKYFNKRKKIGTRKSKLEIWIESQLTNLYPNLSISYNKKDAIGSELDIYIPSLKLAFELNGIFHYEPIYGDRKLDQTIENDKGKFQACREHGIALCVIDTSKQKYFKEKTSLEYLSIITSIINEVL
jgi:hypothetical protein